MKKVWHSGNKDDKFDFAKPTATDPFLGREFCWAESKEYGSYYFWAQPVVAEVELHKNLEPIIVSLGHRVQLTVYKGLSRQDILYRLTFQKEPARFLLQPCPYTMFWSYGSDGTPSKTIKYHFKDKNLSVHSWVDRSSFLADLRSVHYTITDYTFWSR